MEYKLDGGKLGLDDPSIFAAAVEIHPELFFALHFAQACKEKGCFPILSREGLTAVVRDMGSVLQTPRVQVRESDTAHVAPNLFPIADAADFVRKISRVIRSVHIAMAASEQAKFEREAKRDGQGRIVRCRTSAITRGEG